MKLAIALLAILLSGCITGSLQNLTAAQLNALQGMVLCEEVTTVYGSAVSVLASADTVRKGATRADDISLVNKCGLTIKSAVGVAPVSVQGGASAPAAQAIIITPSAPTITVAPVVPAQKP